MLTLFSDFFYLFVFITFAKNFTVPIHNIMRKNASKMVLSTTNCVPFRSLMSVVDSTKKYAISIFSALFGVVLMVVLILFMDHGVGSTDHL